MSLLVGETYKTHAEGEIALRDLHLIGIEPQQINVVLTDEMRGGNFNLEETTKVEEGIAAGTTAGGVIGAAVGAMTAAGTIAVPGLNLVATGVVVGSMAGLATGATAGGVVGGLIGSNIPEYEAKINQSDNKAGAMLVTVKAKDYAEKKRIQGVLK